MHRAYGWIRDLPDFRDLHYTLRRTVPLPSSIDLRPDMPPVWDQGALGACVGHATAAAIAYARIMQGLPTFTPSRLMLYYGARALERTIAVDVGAQIRDGIKSAADWGACSEDLWPYDPTQFAVKPPQAAYDGALKDRAIGYRSVAPDLDHLRSCLADGDPIVIGISVYESFESDAVAASGLVPLPGPTESPSGGHAVLICGYDDASSTFIVRNSWGADWGKAGYALFPYSYLTNPGLAADFWKINLVTPGGVGYDAAS